MVVPGYAVRFATAAEAADWDSLIAANPAGGEVWQGNIYLAVKKAACRYREYRLVVERTDGRLLAVGVLAKRVPFLGEWWHIPAGPTAFGADNVASKQDTLAVVDAIAQFARANGAFFLKVEPRLPLAQRSCLIASGWIPAPRIIPNDSTPLLPLTGESGAILDSLPKKQRSDIKRRQRQGVRVQRVPATAENCAKFYALLQQTAAGKFVLRPAAYYREYWQRYAESGTGQMVFAFSPEYKGGDEPVSAAFGVRLGSKSTYKDGANAADPASRGTSALTQLELLEWARESGVTLHDMCGAPPVAKLHDKTHPLYGVGVFKRNFGAEVVDYVGAFDIPLRKHKYTFWRVLGDRLARRLSLAIWKDPYY